MPNTLAHMGIQAVLTRSLAPKVDIGWIWLGCILPDLPWILQRIVRSFPFEFSVFDIRAYAVVQSSLLVCLVGAAAAAMLSSRPPRVFWVVGLGSVMHLLLDAMQAKWANGVLLAVPFDWRVLNLEWFWPEDPATAWLTILGAIMFIWAGLFWRTTEWPARGSRHPGKAAILLLIWVLAPIPLIAGAKEADVHFIRTLENFEDRSGRAIAFDRAHVVEIEERFATLQIWTGEHLEIHGANLPEDARIVSIIGRFQTTQSINVESVHLHAAGWRDTMSVLGLLAIFAWWIHSVWQYRNSRKILAAKL